MARLCTNGHDLAPTEQRCGDCGAHPAPVLAEETADALASYREALAQFWADGVLEDWEAAELVTLRDELGIRIETHVRLEAEFRRPNAPPAPASLFVDAASMAHFAAGERCLVRFRAVNDGQRPVKQVRLLLGSSAATGTSEISTRLLGPGRDEVVMVAFVPELAGHHDVRGYAAIVDMKGQATYLALAPVAVLVARAAAGSTTSVMNIDASSMRVGDLSGLSAGQASAKGGLVQGGDWKKVTLSPATLDELEAWRAGRSPPASPTRVTVPQSEPVVALNTPTKDKSAVAGEHNASFGESLRQLRERYTRSKRADAAWCVCQVLTNLQLAEPDEERFFKRHRAKGPAPAQSALNAEDWSTLIRHRDRDPLLTSVLALIEPAITVSRDVTLQAEGYDLKSAVDLANVQHPMSQTLYYACGALGLEMPIVFHNPNLPGGLAFVHASPRALALGRAALDPNVPPQALAFMAAQKLAYFTPGQYARQLVSTSAALKAWLFGAIKLALPSFPIAPELEGPVAEAVKVLVPFRPSHKAELIGQVGKLLQSGTSIDLERWIGACDFTADRAGLLLAHDLEVALTLVGAGDAAPNAPVTVEDRVRELRLFAASEDYLALRQKLGVRVDD